MKIKPNWESIIEEKMSQDFQARLSRVTKTEMKRLPNSAKSIGRFRPAIFWPLFTAGFSAIILVFLVSKPQKLEVATKFRDDPEMIREAALLNDLPLLRKLAETRQFEKRKWRKKRS